MANPKIRVERRKCSRIKKPIMISFYDKQDAEKKHDITQVKNIGWGGVCFVSSNAYKPGTLMCIDSQTSYFDKPTHLEGMIIKSCEKVPDLLYEQHLMFDKLNPEANFFLKKIYDNPEGGHSIILNLPAV